MEYFVNAWERLIITFENFTGNIGNEHKLIEFSDSSGINCGEIGSPRSFIIDFSISVHSCVHIILF